MFESIVATVLNRFLGSYIENFDPKQLNIGIWGGDVRLKNLRLKKESLDKFKLPVDVKFGHLGELTLQIPWSNLKGKPVKVIIEDVYLLASPVILNDFDAQEDFKREQQLKQEKLNELEALQSALNVGGNKDSSGSNESFTESLVTKIVDNLQITIKNIHIRYEDNSVLTESPYALGITLDELSAASTDENWQPSFITITESLTRKLLLLKNLACYMNTELDSILADDPEETLSLLKQTLPSNSSHQYLLKPVSGEGRLIVHKAGATEAHPHVNAELFFDEFGIDFDSSQYRDILWTASKFHWYQKTWKFRRFRPKLPVEEAPKEWFRYTAKSILNEIHEKNYCWSWDHFKKRRDQRVAYIRLWKPKVLQSKLSAAEEEELKELEEELSFDDIKFYRSLARGEIRKQKLTMKPVVSEENAQKNAGWFFSWWGGQGKNESQQLQAPSDEGGLNLSLSEEERKALYDTIDYDENQKLADSIDLPRDRNIMEVFINLKQAGVFLKRNKNESSFAEIIVEGCHTQLYTRPDSFLTNFQLQELRVEDGTSKTLYKHIVSVKHNHTHVTDSADTSRPAEDPFFQIWFESNPLDKSADSKLLAKLKSMTVFYNAFFSEEVIKFFQPPKVHLDTIGAIMNAAEATVEGLTTQTRLGLQYALEEHKTINVQLDLQAPLIILPLDPTSWKSPVAILDAGHISVNSALADKSVYEEVRAKESYDDEDWSKLQNLMYDQFNLRLQDTQFLVGPSIKSTMEQLHSQAKEKSSVILDKLDLKLSLGISILPEATHLARFKMGGEIPAINVKMNDYQYKTFMKLIDTLIPNLDELDSDESSVFNAFGQNKDGYELEEVDKSTESLSSVKDTQNTQRLFEMDFLISSVVLQLSRCVDPVTLAAEPFVDLVGDKLSLGLFKTEKDMVLDLSLTDINLIDHIEKSGIAEFEKLVSSNNFTENEAIERKKPELVKVHLTRSQRIVEFQSREIEVFDQDILVEMSALKCVVSRKSYLNILNFILNTFTDPNAEATPADELRHNDYRDESLAPQKINVDVNLDSIVIVLNEDDMKLATLQLSTAQVKTFVLPEALEVSGCLGALTLHDESNHGSARDSVFRQLISIEGNNLAEFTYKTLDPGTNKQLYNSSFELVMGSTTVNFVEDAFGKIFNYLNKFSRMKAIYDKSRDAAINQASQIDYANRMKLNVTIGAPTVHMPKLIDAQTNRFDVIVAHLGELYLHNNFESEDEITFNKISAGLRNTNINSTFHFNHDVVQEAKMVDNLDLSFLIDYVEDFHENIPSLRIKGSLPDIDMHLTDLQLNYLYNIQNRLSAAFGDSTEEPLEDIEADAENANALIAHDTSVLQGNDNEEPKEKSVEKTEPRNPERTKMVVDVDVPRISLTLYNRTLGVSDLETSKLTSLAINQLKVSLDMKEDDNFSSDLTIHSFTISDLRASRTNKFPEIIPLVEGGKKQLVLNASSGLTDSGKTTTVMMTVEEPLMILAIDYICELQAFAAKGLEVTSALDPEEDEDDDEDQESQMRAIDSVVEKDEQKKSAPSTLGFSVNVTRPAVILLADSADENTEAIVFKIEQVLITSQNIVSLAADRIGMFTTRMNEFEEKRLRIIDDFSVSFALDDRGSTPNSFLTNIQLSIEPLLIRVALREIRLATRIANRAQELYAQAMGLEHVKQPEKEHVFSEDFKRRLSNYAPSIVSSFSKNSAKRRRQSATASDVIVKGEEFVGSIGGARLVLIGDVHELPILDMNIKPFEAKVVNWSTDLSAETHFEPYVNIYNYAKSTWEPLIEPWPVSIYASRTHPPKANIMVDVVSRHMAQISVSSRSIALLSQIAASISDESEKPRDEVTPYMILNETGMDIDVWIDEDDDSQRNKTTIKSNERINWSFEDWRKIRENLDSDSNADKLALEFKDRNYLVVRNINASGEGEDVITLNPPVKGVHNRLSCEISLGLDNRKTIILRSTVKVQNNSDTAIALRLLGESGLVADQFEIEENQTRSLPIEAAYSGRVQIKPLIQTQFDWSDGELKWKELMRQPSSLCCSSLDSSERNHFYYQVDALYDEDEPLARIYPHFTMVVSAPLEIMNYLPFDFNFRLYDKSTKRDWSGSIKKGATNYAHVVTLKSLLLLSVEPTEGSFGKSEFAIINTAGPGNFKRETSSRIKNENGQVVFLKLYYPKQQGTQTNLKVVVYSPYIVLNRTGQNLLVSDRSNRMGVLESSRAADQKPHMFSFEKDNDTLNRAVVKLGESVWSAPISFDAIGQSSGMEVQVSGKQTEMNFGINIGEGMGKYKLTKVVTFTPRYIIKNSFTEPILVIENGATQLIKLEPQELMPMYNLHRTGTKSALLKFAQNGKDWTSPFSIDDIGQIFLKAQKEGQGQTLLKVNVLTEQATVFIQIESANNKWPYSIRNFTDTELYIYQSNPNVDTNGEIVKNDIDYKPIYYKIPAKSVMPYAYDYPNAIVKDLVLRAHGRERAVNLAEIGNLKPFRLPPVAEEESAILDLSVVADGPTQSLVITNYDPGLSLYKLKKTETNASSTSVGKTQFEVAEDDDNYYTKIVTRFEGFGISLINTRSQELCYITLRGLEFRYNESDLYQNLSMKLKWIQIDNQLYGGIFPIILYPSVVPKSGKELNSHPSLSASVCKVKDESYGVVFIKYATVLLQEMTIEVDEDFLFALLDFSKVPGASWNNEIVDKLCDDNLDLPEPTKLSESSDIYFEALHLQPTLTNLSFVRTERVNAEDRTSPQNTVMFFVNILTMAIGNINEAPIKLNALFIENIRVPIPILMQSILAHYGQSFFYQVHKILGSADFLGNPVGLFNNLSSGVLDIFYEPYQGFIINDRPQEVGIGIAKGGLSFLKKSVFGFSGSIAKVTGSLAKGLSVATMDKEFQDRRRLNIRRNKPRHALYGFASGANSFFDSVSSGFTGIATAPAEGAAREGAQGFFKGLGRGVVGLPTKAAIGIFDLASNVSEGIRNTTTVFDVDALEKVRLPRYISYDKVIRPYSQREAQGQFWLKSIDGGSFFNETYLAHLLLAGEEKAVVVTFKKIIMFGINTMKVIWIISFEDIRAISLEATGITIKLKHKEGPFIPIAEKRNRDFLYGRFKIAVEKFNTHARVTL